MSGGPRSGPEPGGVELELTAEAILGASPGPLGERLVVVPRTGSTNEDLVAAARRGAAAGAVLVADSQSAGRGRLGRSWHSPPGANLHLSVLLRPRGGLAACPPLALVAGVAVAEAVEAETGLRPVLKWPNDVLVETAAGPRKVAGVLAEAVAGGEPALVLGLGVDVNLRELPPELASSASSLALETGRTHDRARLAAALLRRLAALLAEVEAGRLAAALDLWRARAHTLGRRVRLGEVEGLAEDVGADGALLVCDGGGVVHRLVAGSPEDLGAPGDGSGVG